MIEKIISGGHTGADTAALDVAIELGIPFGGWIPKGRRAEEGPKPNKYKLHEMPTDSNPKSTEQNVIDSDGTLIVSHGKLTGGSAYSLKMAREHNRPCLHIDLNQTRAFIASAKINNWIYQHEVEVLYVAGPRASKDPAIYESTVKLLKAVFFMDLIEKEMPDPEHISDYIPQTVEEAVHYLSVGLSLKYKATIARMDEDELSSLHPTLGKFIRDKFGLWSKNENLADSCRFLAREYEIHYGLDENDCSALIIKELWKKLKKTYVPRIVK
ncbi:YpsA SLOG family protein [Thermodesulfobacteriota bacterium]